MTPQQSLLLGRVMRLHDRMLNDPDGVGADELGELAREADARGILLFRLVTDHYPQFLPFYYLLEEAV